MIAVFAAFYSRNLSSDTKRAKRARAARGEFNGSVAPIGYILITSRQATQEQPAGLYVDPDVAPIVLEAFQRHATGRYSDRTTAEWMSEQPTIQRYCQGKRPIGKEMVRDMLQNHTYTGRVPYAETLYNGASLGQNRKSRRGRMEWFEGKHEPIVSDELFEACQTAREKMCRTRKTEDQSRSYILPDRVYCAHCIAREHDNIGDQYYGKIRIAWHNRDQVGYYRCMSRDRGFGKCTQPYVAENIVIEQLVKMLSEMQIPPEALQRIDTAVKSRESNQQVLAQVAELEEQQQRVQFSWEYGKLLPEEYLAKTSQLEREIASLRPLDYDRLEEAADLITHFTSYWDQCADVDDPQEARRQLMSKIIDRVFLYNHSVIAVALYPDFGIVLDMPDAAPDQILKAVASNKNGHNPKELYPLRERRDSNPRSRP
ncbi:MAG: recombinase family protein [Anaerolineae bacterium]|nr:recombinase family protein [Anaerolineae bacterium]